LRRLQKKNYQKSPSGGIKHSDLPSKDPGCLSFLNSFNKQQNEGAIDSFGYSDGTSKIKMDTTSHEKRRASTSNISDPRIRKSIEIGLNQSLESAESEANHTVFDSTIPRQYSWNEVPKRPLKEELNTLVQLKDNLSHLPLNVRQQHFQIDQSLSTNSNPSDYKSDYISPVNSMASSLDTFPSRCKSLMSNDQSPDIILTSNLSSKTPRFNLGCISDMEIYQRNLILGIESASTPLDEDLNFLLLQGEYYDMNFDMQNIEMSEYYDPRLNTEVPINLYASPDYS